jgi:molybdate transport system substrate-binding protein
MGTLKLSAGMVAIILTGILFIADAASGDEIRVMATGAFTAAFLEVIPEFERTTNQKVVTTYGASIGDGPDTIPSRLRRGEHVDVLILASSALDELVKQGKVIASSRVDLVRSSLGMAVRAGARKPDISSVDALTRTILQAKSIAYSTGTSGVFLSSELFQRLGIDDQVRGKSHSIEGDPVGAAVARGEAEIGFQQISELLPVPGIDYVGPLPPGAQRTTVMAAGVAVGAKSPEAARALIAFLASSRVAPAMRKSGFDLMLVR